MSTNLGTCTHLIIRLAWIHMLVVLIKPARVVEETLLMGPRGIVLAARLAALLIHPAWMTKQDLLVGFMTTPLVTPLLHPSQMGKLVLLGQPGLINKTVPLLLSPVDRTRRSLIIH